MPNILRDKSRIYFTYFHESSVMLFKKNKIWWSHQVCGVMITAEWLLIWCIVFYMVTRLLERLELKSTPSVAVN
jgi:uncharacterized protein (UPF0332 family)